MKRTILAIAILLGMSVAAFAQAPASSFSVELTYAPIVTRSTAPAAINKNLMSTDLAFNINLFKYGFVEGAVQTILIPVVKQGMGIPTSGWPVMDGYLIGIGAARGPITVGYRHECTHPVAPGGWFLLKADTAYDNIYIRYDMKF